MEFIKTLIESIKSNYVTYLFYSWFFCFLMYALYKITSHYYSQLRGFWGERWVKDELNKLPKTNYKILNNITISDEKGIHQIDHIVVSKYGIFVIEMKNYYGLIRGNEYWDYWMQYVGKNKRTFKNPIYQNYGHIKALANLLNIDENKFFSIICFSNQAKLKVICKTPIVQTYEIALTIGKYQEEILDNIEQISESIIKNNIKDKKAKKEHTSKIQNQIKLTEEKISKNICPKCGSKLVERKSKYGSFLGCSSYPKCKFTKQL